MFPAQFPVLYFVQVSFFIFYIFLFLTLREADLRQYFILFFLLSKGYNFSIICLGYFLNENMAQIVLSDKCAQGNALFTFIYSFLLALLL